MSERVRHIKHADLSVHDDLYCQIWDNAPESFWRVTVWDDDGNPTSRVKLDVADRRRIIVAVIEQVLYDLS